MSKHCYQIPLISKYVFWLYNFSTLDLLGGLGRGHSSIQSVTQDTKIQLIVHVLE